MSTIKYGNTISSRWRAYALYTTEITSTQFKVTVRSGFENVGDYNYKSNNCDGSLTFHGTTYTAHSDSIGGGDDGARYVLVSNKTYTWNRDKQSHDRPISFSTKCIGGSIAPGTSSGSFTITQPALTNHTVSYNANGGSGSISSQTKWYGQPITLSSSGFTRTNYKLISWNTKANGSGTTYKLGATYSVNQTTNVTLYAQWELFYTKPNIYGVIANRQSNEDEVKVSFNYTVGKTGGTIAANPRFRLIFDDAQGAWISVTGDGAYTTTYTDVDINTTHTIKVEITDDDGGTTVSANVTISTAQYPIDLLSDGSAMALMGVAQSGKELSLPDETYIGNHSSAIGDTTKHSTTKLVSTVGTTGVKVAQITLDMGVWIVTGSIQYAASNSSAKRIAIGLDTAGTLDTESNPVQHNATNAATYLSTSRILSITDANTHVVSCNGYCGVSTSVTAVEIRAVRIV